MKSLPVHEVKKAIRQGARYGSVLAALLVGLTFATDRLMYHQYGEILKNRSDYFGVGIFVGLAFGLVLSYLLAATKRWALPGCLLAICSVAGMYVWSNASLGEFPDSFLAVLAVPALFRVSAVRSEGRAIAAEVVPISSDGIPAIGAVDAA